jgi:hypothetical protein
MATKSNPVKDRAGTGAAPARERRKSAAARPGRSTAEAETPVSRIENSATELTPAVSASSTAHAEPSREQIARLAYSYWLDRGGQNGSPEEDWLRAEQALRQAPMIS